MRREPKARHGRHEERRLWALCDPELNAYLDWPHLQQVCRLERRRVLLRQGRAVQAEHEVTYLIASAGPERAAAAALLRANRGHWGIEIVQSQMTKPGVFATWTGGDDVADLDLVVGDHDPIDEQFHQLSSLLEGRAD